MIDARDCAVDATGVQRSLTTIVVTKPLNAKQLQHLEKHEKFIFWDAKKNYDYPKVTKDRSLLAGFGDKRTGVRLYTKHALCASHVRHLRQVLRRLFPDIAPEIAYAWSRTLGVTRTYFPLVRFDGAYVVLAGTSSQVVSTLVAQYAALWLMGRKSALDVLFTPKRFSRT